MSFALNIQTADDLAAQAQAARARLVKAECSRRIFDVVDGIAQINMAAAAATGRLNKKQMQTYRDRLTWIDAMRASCQLLIADPVADYRTDTAWAKAPDNTDTLISRV